MVNASDSWVIPRKIVRLFLQSFTAARFKWSPSLTILRYDEPQSDAFTQLVRRKKLFRKPFERDSTDARSLAQIKRRRTCCTLSIYFGVATTQMCCIFQKVCDMRSMCLMRLPSYLEKKPLRKPLQRGGTDTRPHTNSNRRYGKKCTGRTLLSDVVCNG